MDLSNVFLIDFETTDVDPKKAVPVEVAIIQDKVDFPVFEYVGLINPEMPIPVETSAIHHITNDDVATAYNWTYTKQYLADIFRDRTPIPIFVAHNAAYEKEVLGDFVPVIWICTYKCALRIWPEAPNHKNETLRYYLGQGTGRKGFQKTHSARHDCVVTLGLLKALLEHATIEQLVEWTEQPAKLPRVPFGMHRGKKWDEVPESYFAWMFKQSDMNPDVIHCAKEEMARRRNKG